MRLPPVPGPRDVVRLLERGAGAVEMLLAAAPRAMALLDDAGRLLLRANELIERIDETRSSADAVVRRTDQVVTKADSSLDRTDAVLGRAEAALAETAALTGRLRELLDATEPSLLKLQPTLERIADTTHPEEVDALVSLVDQLPLIAARMETEIVPIIESMGNVGPDIHDLLDLTRELNVMLASVPGLSKVKKRIDDEQAEDETT